MFKRLSLTLFACAVTLGCSSEYHGPLNAPSSGPFVERGRYLARGLAACGFCHGEKPTASALLAGGRPQADIYGDVNAPNITPAKSGIGDWEVGSIVRAIRGSVGKNERQLSSTVHRGFEWMADDDVVAIVSYLKSLPPVENEVERRSIGFIDRNTVGFFDVHREVQGYVPALERRYAIEYGNYLVDNVARCGSCHNKPSTVFGHEVYLDGGATIKTEIGDKIAPGITGSDRFGIGGWSEEQIVHYLKTGETTDTRIVDPRACPIGFYANAEDQDLLAIAKYLRTVPSGS